MISANGHNFVNGSCRNQGCDAKQNDGDSEDGPSQGDGESTKEQEENALVSIIFVPLGIIISSNDEQYSNALNRIISIFFDTMDSLRSP